MQYFFGLFRLFESPVALADQGPVSVASPGVPEIAHDPSAWRSCDQRDRRPGGPHSRGVLLIGFALLLLFCTTLSDRRL